MTWIPIGLDTVGALIPALVLMYGMRRSARRRIEPQTVEEYRQELAKMRGVQRALYFWLIFSSAWICMVASHVEWTDFGDYTTIIVVGGLWATWGVVIVFLERFFGWKDKRKNPLQKIES
jgi:hypothetical protein